MYWRGSGADALVETDLSGNAPIEYIFFDGKRIARRDSGNGIKYYLSDHLRSTSTVTDAQGTILDESDYYPYGAERVIANGDPNHYKFNGKERDTETGLDYFGARYYGSNTGRWMSPDWAATQVAVPFADLENPQTLNLYAYAINNPVTRADLDGHDGKEFLLTGKYTARLDKTNPNDYPNIHIFKSGNEISRGKVTPAGIDWDDSKTCGLEIKELAEKLATEKGMFEAAAEREAAFAARQAARAKMSGASKALVYMQLIDLLFQGYEVARSRDNEAETGYHLGALGQAVVTDLGKFGQYMGEGAQIVLGYGAGAVVWTYHDGKWVSPLRPGAHLEQDRQTKEIRVVYPYDKM